MLLTLHILKIGSGVYRARVMEGAVHLGDYEATKISECILLASGNPLPDLTGFHLWYEHVCAGIVTADEMREAAEELADRLVALHGLFSA